MIPFLFIGGGLYFLFDALGNQRPSVDPADLGLPTKGFRGYRKGGHYEMGGRTEPDDEICSACRGSGEGSTPDSTCSICGGSGVIEPDEEYDGYESDGDDTDYEKEWGGLDNFKNGGQIEYSMKAFEELKKYISCKGFCNEEQELHITQSRETENPSSPNYKQIFAGIRDWGEWEKDEDSNDMVLTKDSIKRLNDIISIIKKRYPVNIVWDVEEKNWLSFQIKEKVYKDGGKTPRLYAVLYLNSEPIADVEVDSQDERAALKKFQDMGVNIPANSTIRFQKNEPYYYENGGETKKFWANEGLREIIKEIVLKLYKFSPNQVDISYVNPISKEDFKKIRRSVRYNLKKEGGYFTVTDEELKQYLIQLGGEGDFKN